MKIDFVIMFSEKRAKRGGRKLPVLSLPLPENNNKINFEDSSPRDPCLYKNHLKPNSITFAKSEFGFDFFAFCQGSEPPMLHDTDQAERRFSI
jgi:hypothetical protein